MSFFNYVLFFSYNILALKNALRRNKALEDIRGGCMSGCSHSNMCNSCAPKKCYKEMSKPINAKCECKYDMEMTTMMPIVKEVNSCKMWD